VFIVIATRNTSIFTHVVEELQFRNVILGDM